MIHELKILPEHFKAVADGTKRAELRKNDRNYKVGDVLMLLEWDNGYKDGIASKTVTHVCDVGAYAPGFVMLSIE